MNSLEFERAVEAMGKEGCPACQRLHVQIAQAHQDLNASARAASRHENERTKAAIRFAKAGLAHVRENAREHFEQH